MSSSNIQTAFSNIYSEHTWGGGSRSGPGSDVEFNSVYLGILQNLIKDNAKNITSVVDIGCGDWTLAREIDWSGVSYRGIDIVPELIRENSTRYATESIQFAVGNLISEDLPAADLIIIKDVLQHLSEESILEFLPKLNNYKYALITNDVRTLVHLSAHPLFGLINHPKPNKRIADGGWRPVKLLESPFDLEAKPVAYYDVPVKKRIVRRLFTKEILLWERPNPAS